MQSSKHRNPTELIRPSVVMGATKQRRTEGGSGDVEEEEGEIEHPAITSGDYDDLIMYDDAIDDGEEPVGIGRKSAKIAYGGED